MSANAAFVDGREPLLLLPGLLCDTRVFADLAPLLPGGVAAADYGDAATLPAMAARVLDAAPDRFGLLGHSMGARVALEVVRLAPDRVTRLALVSTGIHPPRPGEADKRHALRDLGRANGMAALVDAWLPPMVAPDRQEDDDLMVPLRAMCIGAGLDRYVRESEALLARPAVEPLLATIGCSVLAACGDRDLWSPPAQHRDIADRVPGARLAIVAGAGHMLPAEAPGALAAAVRDWCDSTIPHGDHRRGE